MIFRSKPSVIEAEQYREGQPLPTGVCTGQCSVAGATAPVGISTPHVHTMHDSQTVVLKDGDWVVAEPDGSGRYYPIADEVFRRKYDPA